MIFDISNLTDIDELLSEDDEAMTAREVLETTPGETKRGFTREDAFNLSVDDLDKERGMTRIDGECPNCGTEDLYLKPGGERAEIHCDECETELLDS